MSTRLKLTLSYAGLVTLAGSLLVAVAWVFALRWLPDRDIAKYPMPVDSAVIITGPTQRELMGGFGPAAVAAVVFLLVLGLIGGWILAGRMLAPLTRITEATRTAATGSLSHRIALPGRRDEFRELADAFDAMLARLEADVAEQRRFAANASHELRTPLAITQTLLEAARNDPDRDIDLLIDRLTVVNARAVDLTEALLVLSRAEQRAFRREEVDLSLMAEEAAETLLPLAETHGLTMAMETSGCLAPAVGSPALLLQVATNLVHNAIVHNRRGGVVWVGTKSSEDSVELTVENTGERLTPELLATMTEPFLRGTERIRHDQAGVGLGLAIVKSITQAHGGMLTLSAREGGGLRAVVRLPGVAVVRMPAVVGSGSAGAGAGAEPASERWAVPTALRITRMARMARMRRV